MSRDNPEWEIIALQGRLLVANAVLMEAYSTLNECERVLFAEGVDVSLARDCQRLMSEIHEAVCTKTEAYK